MKKSHSGFTFVELIVVLVIITILSTIGFVTYESYLWMGRDTTKISLIKDMHSSFGTYWLKSRIPLPENKVDISASGTVFAYQWDFTEETANTIGFKWNPYDDSLEIYPSYMLLNNQKDVQILHYLEDPQTIQQALVSNTYAFTDYQQLYPRVIGKALGIMMDSDTQQPLHLIDSVSASWNYDVVTGTGQLRAYYSQSEYYEENISRIIPDKSCKRILELWWSQGNWVYTINPTWNSKMRVYCDMQTDWGWWTFFGFYDNSSDDADAHDFFSADIWSYNTDREDNDISFAIDIGDFWYTEMMVSLDNKSIMTALGNDKLLFLSFPLWNTWFNNGPIPCIWLSSSNYQYKLSPSQEYTNGTSNICDSTRWYLRNQSNSGYLTLFHQTANGNYWWAWMWWNNSWGHDGWWYIR